MIDEVIKECQNAYLYTKLKKRVNDIKNCIDLLIAIEQSLNSFQ